MHDVKALSVRDVRTSYGHFQSQNEARTALCYSASASSEPPRPSSSLVLVTSTISQPNSLRIGACALIELGSVSR